MAKTLEISPENQEFIDFLTKYNIQAQIELNKLGANSELLASISHYIKKKTEGKVIKSLNSSGTLEAESKELIKDILGGLKKMGALTEHNYRSLTISTDRRRGGKPEFESILEKLLKNNDQLSPREFVLTLHNQGLITPVEKRIDPEILTRYQRQLSERKEIFNKIQEGLEGLLKKEQTLEKSDKAALTKFISGFEQYREGAGKAPYLEIKSEELKIKIYKEFPILETLHEIPRADNPFKQHLKGIYHNASLLGFTDIEGGYLKPDDRIAMDEAGSKNLIRAIQKIIKQYAGDFSKLRDVARIRHSHTNPDLALECSFFNRTLSENYGFMIVENDSDIKSVNSATTKSKEIYQFFPKKENSEERETKYILGEVQYMDERQLKWDKEETHNIWGSIRQFIEGSRGNISLLNITWGQVAKFYEDEQRYFERYKKPSSTEIKRLFGEMSGGLKEFLSSALSELEEIRSDQKYQTALFTPSISKYLNDSNCITLHSDNVLTGDKLPFNVTNKTQTFENMRLRIAKGINALNKIHCIIVAASYEKAHPVDRAIFCTLMEPHMVTNEDRKLLAGCQKGLMEEDREKAIAYLNHFDLNAKAKEALIEAGIHI